MCDYVMKPFAELDALILDALNGRSITFSAMCVIPRIEDASEQAANGTKSTAWRIVDRRLQALRKAGKIVYSRNHGWSRP